MPFFAIDTNLPKSKIPANFLPELTTLLSEILGKPEKFIAVKVVPDQMLTFAGTTEPAALCSLCCIGKIGLEENKITTAKLMDKMNQELGIKKDRMYINFYDMARENVGWNGKTFAT